VGGRRDWYDNEHIPLRLNHLPSFLSGARYQSIDDIKPSWIAVYEIDDTKTFKDQSYTVLREKRSQREEDLMGRLEMLDRRTCEVVREANSKTTTTTGLRVGNPSRWVVTHGVGKAISGIADEDEELKKVEQWLNEIVTMLEYNLVVVGWVKTRVLKVLESAKTGTNLGEEQSLLSYFIFHEFVSEESANSPIFREFVEKISRSSLQISESRKWELYKSYPSLSQGNLHLEV